MSPRHRFAPLLLLLAAAGFASGDPLTQSIVNQVSESQYTHYLSDANFLYTHNGNSRRSGQQHDQARANIYNTLAGFGLSTTLDPFSYSGGTYYNVVATLTGTVTPGNIYLVGAHYDSVTSSPGADDNASGVAAVLEAARVLSQRPFQSTIVFIAFDREEQGFIGSAAYASAHRNDNILGMLSLDMIAYRDPSNPTKAYVYSDYTAFRSSVAGAINTYGNGLTAVQRADEEGTDNWPFRDYNKPNGFLEENFDANPYYHSSSDSVDMAGYINYAYATNMTKATVGWLAQSAVPLPSPTIPGDADGNNLVNDADARILAAHWGASVATVWQGDFNHDGRVNAADASILAANWTHAASESTAVPEPSALALATFGLIGLAVCGHRRGR
jgi:Zn-dependent M28 family amino/carboxypeptidase